MATRAASPPPGRLTKAEARRIAVRAQLLDAARPSDLLAVMERLSFLQLDPTAAIAPAADLVAWTRLGDAYRPEQLRLAHERDRIVFEHHAQLSAAEPRVAMVRPMSDIGLHLAEMRGDGAGFGQERAWLAVNDGFRRRVLDLLERSGPLPSRDVPDTADRPWASSGWTNDKNVTKLLELLLVRGEVAVSARRGRDRLWDVASRVYPRDAVVPSRAEARAELDVRRLRSLGVARPRLVGGAGVPVEIEGTKGEWRLDPVASASSFEGRTALLSPFDRLSHDRARALELFDFDYTLEMYKPKAKRRWGYFALPVLHGDQLVGKVDAHADRDASVLDVQAIHQDVRFTRSTTAAVKAELGALARWLELDAVRYA
jgi:uncharacterized protein YcaQ